MRRRLHRREHVAAFNGSPATAQLRPARRAARGRPTASRTGASPSEEINYRRFFDINELAADPDGGPGGVRGGARLRLPSCCASGAVDRAAHRPPRRPVRSRRLPASACRRARASCGRTIRAIGRCTSSSRRSSRPDEPLPADWPVDGTTGYDFLTLVNGLFVRRRNARAFDDIYERFTGDARRFADLVYQKQAADHAGLAGQRDQHAGPPARPPLGAQPPLPRLHAQQPAARAARGHRLLPGLPHLHHRAIGAGQRRATARYIERAVDEAKRRNPPPPRPVFDFVRDAAAQARRLHPGATSAPSSCGSSRKFQQVTGPVMAKGIEDTAFYVYNRLVSLNEVGGEPDALRRVARRPAPAASRSGSALAARRCRRPPRTTPSAARTCAPGSTCCPRCPTSGAGGARALGAAEPARTARLVDGQPCPTATRSTCSTRRCSAPGRSEPLDGGSERRVRRARIVRST